jgi:hypothetical protein
MPQIIVDNGSLEGMRVELDPQRGCMVGSDAACDLQLSGPGIGARHAVIKALKDGGFGIKELDAPVAIGGRAIVAARLRDGDVIDLASVRLRYQENDDAPQSPEARMLAGFKVLEELGRGGMGIVYRAEQVSLHREVALKVLSHELTKDPVFVARFVAEARAAGRLHHPNVVQVFDVGHDGDTYYYSMELMQEGSLERRLKATGRLPVEEALQVIADAARGLAFAESLGIVHRDIKPDNLMLDQHGTVKIADLGLALTDEEDTSRVVGTPHFMSPEQALRKPLDHRSDLYSLGCTFYRLVTGRTPFRGNTSVDILRAHIKEPPQSPREVNPELPAEVSELIEKLLQKSPDDRFQSADELLERIEHIQSPPLRRGLLIGSIATAVLVAAGALWWGLTRKNTTTIQKEIVTQEDPDAARLREEARKNAARAAYYEVKARQVDGAPLEGLSLAQALEKMAAAHPETSWADDALREAKAARGAVAAAKAARETREAHIASVTDKLRSEVAAALAARRLRDADAVLGGDLVPTDLRAEPKLAAVLDELRARLREAGERSLAALRADIDKAREARDPDALEVAVDRLAAALDPQSGWPATALPEPAPIAEHVAAARTQTADLRRELAEAAAEQAWRAYGAAWFDANGCLPLIERMAFAQAADRAEQHAGALGGDAAQEAVARLGELAQALRAAARFRERFVQAAAADALPYRGADAEEDAVIAGLAEENGAPVFTIRSGPKARPKTRVIPLAELHGDALVALLHVPDADPAERGACLALLEIARHGRSAARWLATVKAGDPRSGTGTASYARSAEALRAAERMLAAADAPWVRALRQEVDAAATLVDALRAFSSERYRTAAGHLDRLKREAPHSVIASGLR